MARRGRSERSGGLIWPGFVDAMTALLLVVMFVLSIFMIVQFVLREELTGKDRSLAALTSQLSILSEELGLARDEAQQLRDEAASISELLARERSRSAELADALEIQRLQGEQLADDLAQRLAELAMATQSLERRDAEINETSALLVALRQERDEANAALAALQAEATATVDEAATESARLKAQMAAIRQRLADALGDETNTELTVQEQIAALELALNNKRREAEETLLLLAAAEIKNKQLTEETRAAAEKMTQEERLAAFARASLASEKMLSESSRLAVALLNSQVRSLRQEIGALQLKLDSAEVQGQEAQLVIKDLGAKLNRALARKVGELQKYRSEFFGRIREVLGERDDIRVVGDRFVFQSEVLFDSGSADLGPEGQAELARFARILQDVAAAIPPEINWVLRVDGHTDIVKLGPSSKYASNWELSQARALSVVEHLVDQQDFPADRLAATGFGEFQPIDTSRTREAYARNRRIELKLTER